MDNYNVLTDDQIEEAVKNRIRQLEGEHYSQVLYLAEAEADPHATSDVKKGHREQIESLDARLGVLRQRHEALKANMKKDAQKTTPPTP